MKLSIHDRLLFIGSVITIYLLTKVVNYDYIAKALILIKKFEGLSLNKYKDSGGVDTICYGTTDAVIDLSDIKSLDFTTCENLLSNKVHQLDSFLKSNWFYYKKLNNNQKSALISLSYNIGEYGFINSTLKMMIEKKYPQSEIKSQFIKWSYDNGQLINGLYKRRWEEANLFFS